MNSLWLMDKGIIFKKHPEIQSEMEKDYQTLCTTDFIDKYISYFPELSQAKLMCIRLDSDLASTVYTTLFAKRWKDKVLGK